MAEMMTAEEAAEWGKTLSFEKVWAAFVETDKRIDRVTANLTAHIDQLGERVDRVTENIDKMGERVDRVTENIDKMGERVDRVTENIDKMGERVDRVTENIDKMGERVDRVTANVGGLNESMGQLIETLFASHLGEKFDAYRYNLRRTYTRVRIYDDTNRLRSDIDLLLSNTTVCMAVEVKRWLDQTRQVDEHVKRMGLIRQYPPAETRGKTLLGAMAAGAVDPEVREYAEQSGFFVLELSGEDVRLLPPSEGFKPKEW